MGSDNKPLSLNSGKELLTSDKEDQIGSEAKNPHGPPQGDNSNPGTSSKQRVIRVRKPRPKKVNKFAVTVQEGQFTAEELNELDELEEELFDTDIIKPLLKVMTNDYYKGGITNVEDETHFYAPQDVGHCCFAFIEEEKDKRNEKEGVKENDK